MVECRLPCDVDSAAYESTTLLFHKDKTLHDTVSQRNSSDLAFAEGFIFSLFSIIIVSPNRSSGTNLFGRPEILIRQEWSQASFISFFHSFLKHATICIILRAYLVDFVAWNITAKHPIHCSILPL